MKKNQTEMLEMRVNQINQNHSSNHHQETSSMRRIKFRLENKAIMIFSCVYRKKQIAANMLQTYNFGALQRSNLIKKIIENRVIKIIVEKFPNLKKEVDIQIQEKFRRKHCYFGIEMGRKSVKS